jgi:hypothetical protein
MYGIEKFPKNQKRCILRSLKFFGGGGCLLVLVSAAEYLNSIEKFKLHAENQRQFIAQMQIQSATVKKEHIFHTLMQLNVLTSSRFLS